MYQPETLPVLKRRAAAKKTPDSHRLQPQMQWPLSQSAQEARSLRFSASRNRSRPDHWRLFHKVSGFRERLWAGFKGLFSYSGPSDPRTWVVLFFVFLLLLLSMARIFSREASATEKAARMPYSKGGRGVALLNAKSAHFDDLFTGAGRFSVMYWVNTSLPRIAIDPDMLAGIKSCELSRRLGKPCTNAHVNFVASEGVGSILYYGPSSMLQPDAGCWLAPHANYLYSDSDVTITGRGGTLRVAYEGFRDKYRNGVADFVISDTFCASMTGIPYATNYWDDSKGDFIGCSSALRKGPAFVPIQCQFGGSNAVSAVDSGSLNILTQCFGLDDLLRVYDGNNALVRCYEDESANMCGGREPDKRPVSNIVRFAAKQIEYTVIRVADDRVSFVQWHPAPWILERYVLLSDCAVLEPLCDVTELNCNFPTLKQYLEGGGTACQSAYLIEREFFFVKGATADALHVGATWALPERDLSVAAVSFDIRPPIAACQLFSNDTSVGYFILLNPQRGLEQQRLLSSLAMIYGAVDLTIVDTNYTILDQGVCVKVKIQEAGFEDSLDNALAGMAVVDVTAASTSDEANRMCAETRLRRLPPSLYATDLCRPLPDQSVLCGLGDGCTRAVLFDGDSVDECMCCSLLMRRYNSGGLVSDSLLGYTECDSCPANSELTVETAVGGAGKTCVCRETIVESATRWLYTPYTYKGVEFPYHGTCTPITLSPANVSVIYAKYTLRRLHDSYYTCVREHNACAAGYSLVSFGTAGGVVVDPLLSRDVGCFIDSPLFIGNAIRCNYNCNARATDTGLPWYAHCSGSCGSGSTCRCWAQLTGDLVPDGKLAAAWGAIKSWWLMAPNTAMGNHFVPHFVCRVPDSGTNDDGPGGWAGVLSCVDGECKWRIVPNSGQRNWGRYCALPAVGSAASTFNLLPMPSTIPSVPPPS